MQVITIPSEKLNLLLGFIKKLVKSVRTRECVDITFIPGGIYTKAQAIWVLIPIPLELEIYGFSITSTVLEPLLKAKGDVTFSVGCDEGRLLPVKLKNNETAVDIAFNDHGITKNIHYAASLIYESPEEFHIPENTVSSLNFLETLTTCLPYTNKGNVTYSLDNFCIQGSKVAATDGTRMILVKNVDVPPFDEPFLLSVNITAILPKTGTCQLARTWYPLTGVPDSDKYFYVGLPDCHVWAKCDDGNYPKWQKFVPSKKKGAYKVQIYEKDALVCINCLSVLPKDNYDRLLISVYFEDDRMRIDSCSKTMPNLQLELSKLTTGKLPVGFCFDAEDFRDALKVSTKLWHNSDPNDPLVFEADDRQVFLYTRLLDADVPKPITRTLIENLWYTLEKQPPKKKRYAKADKDTVASLQQEIDKLKKEIEQLKRGVN